MNIILGKMIIIYEKESYYTYRCYYA